MAKVKDKQERPTKYDLQLYYNPVEDMPMIFQLNDLMKTQTEQSIQPKLNRVKELAYYFEY